MRNGSRLARLERLKERVERQRRFEFAATLGERERRREAVDEADDLLAQAREGWAVALREGVHADDWHRLLSYIDHLARSRAHRERQLLDSEPPVAAARERLQDAAKERDAMGRLVERFLEERAQEERRRERRALDEIGRREVWVRGGGHETRDGVSDGGR